MKDQIVLVFLYERRLTGVSNNKECGKFILSKYLTEGL